MRGEVSIIWTCVPQRYSTPDAFIPHHKPASVPQLQAQKSDAPSCRRTRQRHQTEATRQRPVRCGTSTSPGCDSPATVQWCRGLTVAAVPRHLCRGPDRTCWRLLGAHLSRMCCAAAADGAPGTSVDGGFVQRRDTYCHALLTAACWLPAPHSAHHCELLTTAYRALTTLTH